MKNVLMNVKSVVFVLFIVKYITEYVTSVFFVAATHEYEMDEIFSAIKFNVTK